MIPLEQCASVCTCNRSPFLLSHLTSRFLPRAHTRKHMYTTSAWTQKHTDALTRTICGTERQKTSVDTKERVREINQTRRFAASPLTSSRLRTHCISPSCAFPTTIPRSSPESIKISLPLSPVRMHTRFQGSHKRQESIRSHTHTLSHIHTQEMHRKQLFGLGESRAYHAQSAKLPVCRLLCTRCQDSSTPHDRMQSVWPAWRNVRSIRDLWPHSGLAYTATWHSRTMHDVLADESAGQRQQVDKGHRENLLAFGLELPLEKFNDLTHSLRPHLDCMPTYIRHSSRERSRLLNSAPMGPTRDGEDYIPPKRS